MTHPSPGAHCSCDGGDGEGSATTAANDFDAFVAAFDRRLLQALVPAVGTDRARDAATDAFVCAWPRWDRNAPMANREGYAYVAARADTIVIVAISPTRP